MNINHDVDLSTFQDFENVIKLAGQGEALRFTLTDINKKHGAFRDAARLQALATVARFSTEKILQLRKAGVVENTLSELCEYAPGLTAIRLNDFVEFNSNLISRRKALIPAIEKIVNTDLQNYSKVIKGRNIDISCISGAEHQFLSPLFSTRSPDGVRESPDMRDSLSTLFYEVSKMHFKKLDDKLLDAFGEFTCELFKNTQQHACSDSSGVPYSSHVEGIIVSFKDLEANVFKKDFDSHPRLVEYWNERSNNSGSGEKLRCVQISFFDTGPGMVSRAFGNTYDNASVEDEKNALLKCLRKNFTSKTHSGAGNGYPVILTQLGKIGGLIKIRTNKQSIFNCFSINDQKLWNNESQNNKLLRDNKMMDFDSWTKEILYPASGTVVSIIVPMGN